MSSESSDFEEALITFAAAMDAIGVPYMVTGSTALNFYAQPRMTRDIDIVIDAKPADARLIIEVLSADFDADPDVMRAALREQGIFNVFTTTSVKIDVITRDRMLHPDETLARTRRFMLHEQEVCVISPEDLVVAKLYWARDSRSETQLRDVRNLLSVDGIDLDYVRGRVSEMRLDAVWREAMSA